MLWMFDISRGFVCFISLLLFNNFVFIAFFYILQHFGTTFVVLKCGL